MARLSDSRERNTIYLKTSLYKVAIEYTWLCSKIFTLVSSHLQQEAHMYGNKDKDKNKLFERLRNKEFWIWDKDQHMQQGIKTDGDCCFNHIIGLPQKDCMYKPLFEYEQIIFDSLAYKHLWIKKATGLDVSEFMLRFMAWLCLKDNALAGSQMCIVTGPRIELAIALIDRMKRLFSNSNNVNAGLTFNTKETVIELNGVKKSFLHTI
jgi:hypothetical protein